MGAQPLALPCTHPYSRRSKRGLVENREMAEVDRLEDIITNSSTNQAVSIWIKLLILSLIVNGSVFTIVNITHKTKQKITRKFTPRSRHFITQLIKLNRILQRVLLIKVNHISQRVYHSCLRLIYTNYAITPLL